MQFLAGKKVPLTDDSDNLNVKVLDLKSTIKFKMKKVIIYFLSLLPSLVMLQMLPTSAR